MAKKLKYSSFDKILNNKQLTTSANNIVANIRFKGLNESIKTLSVISATKSEGKTTIAISTAAAFARAGYNTLLVDADIHQHTIAHAFRGINEYSMYDVLSHNCRIEQAIIKTETENLYFMDCVKSITSIPELVSTKEFNEIFNIIKSNFDMVVFDTPPLLPCIDGAMLSAICDGSIIVVRQFQTKKDEINQLIEQINVSNINAVGTVLNFSDHSEYKYY